jgi:serine/threonine protein phosphatase 1
VSAHETKMADETSDETPRLYVIGDIHGCLDLLERTIAAIHRDHADKGGAALTVTVGDYMDRGPHSRGVIERLAANPFPTPYVALKGNHEELFETFLSDPSVGDHWRRLGGLETLASFGVPVSDLMLGRNAQAASDDLAKALTATHRGFFNSLRTSYTAGRYFLCHAGVRPGVALERQSEHDLLWIREEFLNSRADFGKIVVHGHTPIAEPEILPNRINIDTGAFATGRLTCIVLENGTHRFLT